MVHRYLVEIRHQMLGWRCYRVIQDSGPPFSSNHMAEWNMKLSVQPHLRSRKKKYPKSKFDIKLLKTSEQSFQMIFLSVFHVFKEKKNETRSSVPPMRPCGLINSWSGLGGWDFLLRRLKNASNSPFIFHSFLHEELDKRKFQTSWLIVLVNVIILRTVEQ